MLAFKSDGNIRKGFVWSEEKKIFFSFHTEKFRWTKFNFLRIFFRRLELFLSDFQWTLILPNFCNFSSLSYSKSNKLNKSYWTLRLNVSNSFFNRFSAPIKRKIKIKLNKKCPNKWSASRSTSTYNWISYGITLNFHDYVCRFRFD